MSYLTYRMYFNFINSVRRAYILLEIHILFNRIHQLLKNFHKLCLFRTMKEEMLDVIRCVTKVICRVIFNFNVLRPAITCNNHMDYLVLETVVFFLYNCWIVLKIFSSMFYLSWYLGLYICLATLIFCSCIFG